MDLVFGILSMSDNYEERCVANSVGENYTLDTALVTDRCYKYETAVKVEHYNNGMWIIIDQANTKKDAIAKHKKWEKLLDAGLPDSFYDIYECESYEYEEC